MHADDTIFKALVFLLAIAVAVPLFNRLKLGPILAYLVAGALLGPSALAPPIGVTTMKRVEAFKDVPTVNESGLKGYDVVLWHGLIAPKNLPRPILDRVNGELNKILKNKDMQDKLAGDGVSAAGGTSEQFGALIAAEQARWKDVVSKAKITIE